jgi:hypothetical protein
MAGIAHQPVLTMTSLQMITLTSLIDDAKVIAHPSDCGSRVGV